MKQRVLCSMQNVWRIRCLAVLLLCFPLHIEAQQRTATPDAWRSDLQLLASTLTRLHPGAFVKTPQADFDAAVADLNQRIPNLSDGDIAVEFSRITALIGDAHTTIYLLQSSLLHRYPIHVQWFSDGLFVTESTASAKTALGRRIRAISGIGIDDIMSRLDGVIPHENRYWLEYESQDFIVIPEVLHDIGVVDSFGTAKLELDDGGGGSMNVDIEPLLSTSGMEWIAAPGDDVPSPLYKRDPTFNYWLQYLSSSRTVFFKYNVCSDSVLLPLSSVITQILNLVDTQPVDRVVIDLRNNGGGASNLITPLISGLQLRAIAGRFNMSTQLVALIGHQTFSSAMQNAATISLVTGKLVGEPTGGKPNGFGEVANFQLPFSRLVAQYSTRFFRNVAGDPDSLVPDIAAPISSGDYFSGRDPVLDAVLAGGSSGTADSPITIPRGGGTLLEATSSDGALKVGHVAVAAAGTKAPQVLAVFRNQVRGVTVSEATIVAQPAMQSGRLFAEWNDSVRTGVAFSNPSVTETAVVQFYFTDANGTDISQGSLQLAPDRQTAKFVDEEPFRVPSGFTGTMTFLSNIPIAATALRGFVNQRSEFLISTLPVFGLNTQVAANLVLPHVADGGGWVTEVLLVNTSDEVESGAVRFLSSAGRSTQTVPYVLAPRSAQKIQTAGAGDETQTLTARILPDAGSRSPAGSAVLRLRVGRTFVSEGAVPALAPRKTFRLPVDGQGAFSTGQAGSRMTGIAIANSGNTTAIVQATFSGLNGQLYATTSFSIPANSQLTQYIKQLPVFSYLQTPFRGVLTLTSSSDIAAVGVWARYNERGEFLFAAIPPLEDSAATEVFVPQLVAGGGYSTQLVLIESTNSNSAIVRMRFVGIDGLPVAVNLH